MYVEPRGPLPGRTIEEAGLRHLPGLFISAIERDAETIVAVGPEQRLHAGDGIGISGESQLAIRADAPAELLLFDLA